MISLHGSLAGISARALGGNGPMSSAEGAGGRCEYRYGYHPEPVQCDNAARWIMTDEDGGKP